MSRYYINKLNYIINTKFVNNLLKFTKQIINKNKEIKIAYIIYIFHFVQQ